MTEKQLAANRLNAQKSTGPRTEAGKARSALNALETGIYAESLVLPEEQPEELRKLTAEYYLCYTPRTPAARNAIDNLIRVEWFSRRLARIDTQILAHEIHTLWKPDPGCTAGQAFASCRVSMAKVQQRITATDNLYHRNLRAFQVLQPDVDLGPAEPEPEASPDPGPQVPDSSPTPNPQSPAPDLPTVQPAETKPETEQMGSFRKTTPAAPKPQPLTPELGPSHPIDIQDCPNCRNLGYHSPSCHYVLRRAS